VSISKDRKRDALCQLAKDTGRAPQLLLSPQLACKVARKAADTVSRNSSPEAAWVRKPDEDTKVKRHEINDFVCDQSDWISSL
jgi:hypothetical protein